MKHNSIARLRSIPRIKRTLSAAFIVLSFVFALAAFGVQQGTSWTYQGKLQRIGAAYNGTCDFQFSLWDAVSAGTQLGTTQPINSVNVVNGLFTVVLDFGDHFGGGAAWLGTSVQCSGDSGFTTLDPRQPITAAPYALSLRPGATIYDGSGASPLTLIMDPPGSVISGAGSGTAALEARDIGDQPGRHAVFGLSFNGNGLTGHSISATFAGVYGQNSDGGPAGRFSGPVVVEGNLSVDRSFQGTGNAIQGLGGDVGVYGQGYFGVQGYTENPEGAGVNGLGSASGAPGVLGVNTGIGPAVLGKNYGSGPAIYGQNLGSGLAGKFDGPVYIASQLIVEGGGTGGNAISGTGPTGVYGITNVSNGAGVIGQADGTDSAGVLGRSRLGSGIYGFSTGAGPAIYGQATSTGFAGRFTGPVSIEGNLFVSGGVFKSGGNFRIDHPLDPANKFLSHSFVESPDMKNIYDGNVTTDASGSATVTLPAYFEALNRDYRYQLTVLGQFAQAIVSRKIAGNTFEIRTDRPGVEVSWQVTGIRQDAYAQAHPIVVEEAKPAGEQGMYLYPAGFGAGEEKSIGAPSRPQTPQTQQKKTKETK